MVRSKKVIVLATLAVITFPVTIGIVAIDLRSFIAEHSSKPSEGKKDEGTGSPDHNSTGSSSGLEGASNTPAIALTNAQNHVASNDAAVMAVLRSRVSDLSTAIEKSKEDEGRIKAELKEIQSFQVSTKKSIKATERAIKEIERQSAATTSSDSMTLRSACRRRAGSTT